MSTAKTVAAEPAETETAPKTRKPATEAAAAAKPTRAMMAEGLKKAGKAFAETKAFSKSNLDALTESATAASRGARSLGQLSVGFAKARIDTNLAAAQSLNNAKSLNDLIDLQHAFAKGAVEAYTTEFGQLTETASSAFRAAVKPLNARATTLFSRVMPTRSA